MARITIVIPNYNGARFIGQTLQSLLIQHYTDYQIFFLDNHSNDDSVGIVKSFGAPRVTVFESSATVGMTENWNRAIELVETPFFCLCHSDDLYGPRYLSELHKTIELYPNAFIAHCRALAIDNHNVEISSPAEAYKDSFWPATATYERPLAAELRMLGKGSYIMAPSPMFRRAAVERIGRFNPHYQMAPDWEYWLRGVLAGFSICGNRERLMSYRRHSKSGTQAHQASFRRYREEIAVLQWLYAEAGKRADFQLGATDFGLVKRTALSDFAARLARGDTAGAARLHAFIRESVPGFSGGAEAGLMRAGLLFGQLGGWALKRAEQSYMGLAAAGLLGARDEAPGHS